MATYIRVKLVKSPIGYNRDQKETVRSLGLRRLNQENRLPDSAAVRGMVFRVKHLVRVIDDETA